MVASTDATPVTITILNSAASTTKVTTTLPTKEITAATTTATAVTTVASETPMQNSKGDFFPIFNDGTTTCDNSGPPPPWITRNMLKETKSECCQNYAFQWDYEKCLTESADSPASYAPIDLADVYYYPDFESIACLVDGNHPGWMAGDYLAKSLPRCCRNSFPDGRANQQCRPICPHCPSTWNDPEATETALIKAAAEFCPGTYSGRAPTAKCSGYVDCINGKPYSSIQDCPSNTKFDAVSGTCTWPSLVTCLLGEDLLGQLGLD